MTPGSNCRTWTQRSSKRARALADMTRESLIGHSPANISIRIRDGVDGPVDVLVTMKTERPDA